MNTLVAFYESQDGGAALHNVAAVQDDHVTTQGDDVRVPSTMNNLIGHACLSAADVALVDARIVAPSLRRIFNQQIGVIVNAVVFGNPPEGIMHPMNPTPLEVDESMNFQINSDGTGAVAEYGLIWFGDGPQSPVSGKIYTIRATASITLAAGVWVNGNITFDQILPVGNYQIVGMRAQGTNLVAARLRPVGKVWRPGVPAVNALGDLDASWFRYGKMGTLAEFHSTNPPTVDCLGVTDTAQVFWFDLIKM